MPSPKLVAIDAGPHRDRVLERRNELVETHLSLVEGIARAIHRSLPPSFELGDLIGVGRIALIHAATSYRPDLHHDSGFTHGVPFRAWARLRVRGAILDACRRGHYLEATRESITPLPIHLHDHEDGWKTDSERALDRIATQPDAEERIDIRRQSARLKDAISFLSEPEKRVVELYYCAAEPTLAEVSAQMALSAPSVRKIHAKAITALRSRLSGGPFERLAA
jgi:RNA polymerase sigma factor (sigma-70 family)